MRSLRNPLDLKEARRFRTGPPGAVLAGWNGECGVLPECHMTEQAHNVGMAAQANTEELWTVREYLRSTWSPDRIVISEMFGELDSI
jgi:hypothetical protein